MYFKNRVEAGSMLADQILPRYGDERCVVVALGDGGVMVGAEIAVKLHCALTMLLTSDILLPREPDPLAAVNQEGNMTFNEQYSPGELEEIEGEYRTLIDQERLQRIHDMNRLLGEAGLIKRDLLENHTVILVSDGMKNAMSLDAAVDFLKPVKLQKLIVATPIASVPVVDRMHIVADDIFCLSVLENFMDTGHYYDVNDVPPHEEVIKVIQNVVWRWKEA